ncbi:hypothetical protein B0H14DRAFT_3888365 [Mycena olivaceomarginata]|nr:hypothetical protein B0H14DRAFT_3888365 [Mycena olivaceomarginata]
MRFITLSTFTLTCVAALFAVRTNAAVINARIIPEFEERALCTCRDVDGVPICVGAGCPRAVAETNPGGDGILPGFPHNRAEDGILPGFPHNKAEDGIFPGKTHVRRAVL